MDRGCFKKELLLTIGLPLAALLLNWLGMERDALTLGRALGVGGYLILVLILCARTICLAGRALWYRTGASIFSGALAILVMFLWLVWPFTLGAGRLNHWIYRPVREAGIRAWQEGELRQVSAGVWYISSGAWDRRLYMMERGEGFSFRMYNGFVGNCEAIYSPGKPPEGKDRVESLGDGWYWVLWR